MSITFTVDFDFLAFFGFGDTYLFHSRLSLFVSGSYSNTHVSSPVMTELRKSGSASRRSVMSWQTVNLRCLWYSERIYGTIFTHNLRIFKFSVRIFHTASLPMESSSQIILTVSRRSARTSCFTRSMLLSVLLVTGLPDL